MKNTPKKAYTPPCFTVVRFAAEKGYASSSLLDQIDFNFWQDMGNGNEQMESYSSGNEWYEGSNHFWD